MADENPKVEISIEASQKTGAVTAAAGEIDKLSQSVAEAGKSGEKASEGFNLFSEATNSLEGALGQLATAAAIGAFFKESVDAAVEEAEALRTLKAAVESTGESFASVSADVERFGQSQAAVTRFSDTETYEALSKLTRVTRDVGQAMTATALAQNIAANTNKDLSSSVQLVNDLISGQERALVSARKELGSFVGDAKNNQEALDNLKASLAGAAEGEDSFTKAQAQAKNNIGEFQEKIGNALLPVLSALMSALGFLVKGYEELGTAIGAAMAASVSVVTGAAEAMIAVQTFQFRKAAEIARETKDELATIAEEGAKDIADIEARWNKERLEDSREKGELKAQESVAAAEKAAQDRKAIEDKLHDELQATLLDDFDLKRLKLEEEVEAARQAGVEKIAIKMDGVQQEVDLESFRQIQELQIAQEQAERLNEIEKKKTNDKRAQDKIQAALDEERKKQFMTTLSFISTLQRAKSKELAAIGKAAAITETIINTAAAVMGAYRSLAWIPAVGPALGASAAALVATAGAAQVAMIAGVQLEKGGVGMGSPDGTTVTMFEKNKAEAVLPLEDPRAMSMIAKAIGDRMGGGAGGGVTFVNTFVLPGLEAVRDPALARAILELLAEQIARETPEARVFTRVVADVAELNAGRAG